MSDDAAELRMEEYKSLRSEILERIRETNTLIISSAGGIGGIYAVIVSTFAKEPHLKFHSASGLTILSFLVMIWTPVVFAILANIKSRETWNCVMELAEQVRRIERLRYGDRPHFPGWEHQSEINRGKPKSFMDRLAQPPYTVVYLAMFVLTLLLAVVSTGYIAKVW